LDRNYDSHKILGNGNDFIIFIAQEHKDRSDLAGDCAHRAEMGGLGSLDGYGWVGP